MQRAVNRRAFGRSPANADAFILSLAPALWSRRGVGMSVSAWLDQSGNGRNWTQGTGAAQPTLNADGSLRFDGADDFMTATLTVSDPTTVFGLVKRLSWTSGDTFIGSSTDHLNIGDSGVSPATVLFAGTSVASNTEIIIGTTKAFAAQFNGAASSLQVNTGTATTGNPGTVGGTSVLLASGSAGGFGNFDAYEFIILQSAPSAAVRAQVLAYLMAVGGL